MGIKTEKIAVAGYEEVVFAEDVNRGLSAIIAIHSTALGPACGGIRMLPYATKAEALEDVLRLAKGMSYKSSLAGIGFGGGKSVIIGDPKLKTPDLLHAFGEFVDSFGGRYIAAKDMNISSDNLRTVKERTRHVLGIEGEPGSSGDPSPITAIGVLRAIEATAEAVSGSKSLTGYHVAVQGIGYVGFRLAQLLRERGARLTVTDIDSAALKRAQTELGAEVVGLDQIFDVECDIFSPCARGAILNPETIGRLKCRAVCGAANNQLMSEADGHTLHRKQILYAPDYAVNSGGIINIFVELDGYRVERALQKADEIYGTMKEIFQRAARENKPPFLIADKLAEERLGGRR